MRCYRRGATSLPSGSLSSDRLAGRAARCLYVATSDLPPDAVALTPARRRVARDLGETAHGEWALHAAEATDVVLQAIARSDGTRASVLPSCGPPR
jgi:hypothetical protein